MIKQILIFLVMCFVLISSSFAVNEVNLHLFYGQGCPHCSRAIDFLDSLSENYPELNVQMHEIYFDDESRELFMRFCSEVDKSVQGVPTIFIDDKTFVGFNNEIAEQIEMQVNLCLTEGCGDIAQKCSVPTIKGDSDPINPPESVKSGNYYSIIGWSFMIIAALYIVFIIIKKAKKQI